MPAIGSWPGIQVLVALRLTTSHSTSVILCCLQPGFQAPERCSGGSALVELCRVTQAAAAVRRADLAAIRTAHCTVHTHGRTFTAALYLDPMMGGGLAEGLRGCARWTRQLELLFGWARVSRRAPAQHRACCVACLQVQPASTRNSVVQLMRLRPLHDGAPCFQGRVRRLAAGEVTTDVMALGIAANPA